MELRWESLESCEKAVQDRGRVLLTTPHLSLVDVGDGELVRVGEAPRVEFVDWRYGPRLPGEAPRPGFWRRLLERLPSPPVEGYDPYQAFLRGPPHPGWTASPFLESAAGLTYLFSQLPLASRCPGGDHPLALRPWEFQGIRFLDRPGRREVSAVCGICGQEVTLDLRDIRGALRLGMGVVTPSRVLHRTAGPAAAELDALGGPPGFLRELVDSRASLGELGEEARTALLISLDEAAEAEALEAEWRKAEELAAIMDGELTRVPGFREFRRDVLSD